jgi:hypothetical protein
MKNQIKNLKTNKIKLDPCKISKMGKIEQSLQVHKKYKIDDLLVMYK